MRRLSSRAWEKDQACTFAAWTYRNSEPAPPHNHDFHELFWVTAGRGIHWLNAEARPMETGSLILVRDECGHSFSASGKPGSVSFFNFAFRRELWGRLVRRHPQLRGHYFDERSSGAREFSLSAAELERLRLAAADLAAGACDALTAEAFLHTVAALLLNQSRRPSQGARAPRWLSEALRQICVYPEFAGGIPRLVQLCGRSHEHVARECRRLLAKPPHALVAEARLRWAAAQLTATDRKVIDIAMECGCGNLGHFYKLFRRHAGLTPSAYRQHFGTQAESPT